MRCPYSYCRMRAAENTLQLPQHLACAVEARRAHHAAAGMRSGTAEIQAAHGRPITRPSRYRAHDEHLVEAHLAVEDVTAGDAETAFEIERGQNLAALDDRTDVGSVFLDQGNHMV